jgi:hypothetical protein
MRRNAAVLALIALAVGAVPALHAQGRDRGLVELPRRAARSGMYLTLGLGAGLDQYRYHDLTEYTDWVSSPAAVLRIGGTPNQNVRLGGELFGWWNSFYNSDPDIQQNSTQTFSAALLDAQFFPSRQAGFYVKGGLGFGRSATSFEFDRSVGISGVVWSVGAGYDLPLSRSLAIAPTIDLYQGSFNHAGEPTESYTERVLNIGASLTFQAGHRRRR